MERRVRRIFRAESAIEESGARVNKAFPSKDIEHVDPFALLHEFFMMPPAGFRDYPHKGFEIVTYILKGAFHHSDDLGNDYTVDSGAVQRVTTGRGICHSEMPGTHGLNRALQLWVALPRALKATNPDIQEVRA